MTEHVAISAQAVTRSFGTTMAVRGLDLEVRRGELYGLVGPDGAGKTTIISVLAGLMAPDQGLAITRLAPFVDRPARALSGGMYKKLALSCALLHQPKVLLLDEPTNGVDPVSRRELWDLIYELVADGMGVLVSTPYMDEAARCHRVALMRDGQVISEGAPGALIDSLEHDVCEVVGGDRALLHPLLEAMPEVVAASPAGARLRVVIAPSQSPTVEAAIAQVGASLRQVTPDFEDLFLARIASEGP